MAILDYSRTLNAAGQQTPLQGMIETRKGLQGLQANDMAMKQQQQQQEAQQAEMQRMQEARMQGVELLKGGTPEQIAEFGVMNPKVMEDLIAASGFVDEQAVKSRSNYAQDVLSGNVSPRDAINTRIQQIESRGGNADQLRMTAQGTDEQIIEAARKDFSVIDPQGFKSYMSATGQDMKKPMTDYQQAMIEESKADREIRKFEAENKRIDSQLKKETNEVKLQELKNKKTDNEERRNQIKKDRSDAAQSVVDSGKSTLDLINKIEDHPGFESAVGAKGLSSLYGLMDEPFAGTEAAGVRSLIETLEAQNFLTAVGEFKSVGGSGSLSDNEGKKLGASLSNLSVAQNEKDFKKSLTVIRNLVKKQMSKTAPQIEKRFSLEPSKTSKANDKIDLSKLTLQELKALRAKG